MKILIITNNLNPDSGWGRYSLGIINELKIRSGIEIFVLSEDAENSKQKILSSTSKINILKNLIQIRKLSKGFDIIHSFDCWPYGVYGMFATLFSMRKLFINGVGTYSVIKTIYSVKGLLMYLSYKFADCVFCISNYTKKRILEKANIKNILTVHMGSTLLPDLVNEEIKRYKEEYAIRDEYPIVLTVGAIKERKGQFETLQAISELKKKYSKILYIIVGNSDEVRYVNRINSYVLENNLENNVRILSDIKIDEDLSFFYNICDVFALNSNSDEIHFEGFGLVILEANQFGKSSIGSKESGIEDAIKDGVTGYLTNQKDVEDIKNKIELVLKGNIKVENIKNWYNSFAWSKTVDEYVKEYKLNLHDY